MKPIVVITSIVVITLIIVSFVVTLARADVPGEHVSHTENTAVITTAPIAGPVTTVVRSADHQR